MKNQQLCFRLKLHASCPNEGSCELAATRRSAGRRSPILSDVFEQNRTKAESYLARFRGKVLPHFINGAPVQGASGQSFENLTPIDNSVLCRVSAGGVAEVDAAARAAAAAFPAWRDLDVGKRQAILRRIADLIDSRAEEIALVESVDTGQTIRFMSSAAARSAENFRYFADRVMQARDGLALPTSTHFNYTMRQPIGPVGIITPWNTPFMLSTWKIAPALAAGCTIVHKPAEWSPLTAMLLAEICKEGGLPDGVLNVVNGIGEEAGKAVTEHPDIKAIGFIGESATGSLIMSQSAPTLKRVHFELGGKNPVIVFDDADLDRALDAVVFMIYSLNGERCTSSSRLLVQRKVHDEFARRLAERVAKIKVGHPLNPASEVGPLAHAVHFDKVISYMDIARGEGAEIKAGGRRAPGFDKGNYLAPTLFVGARNDMRIAQEEIFGPVLTVISFDDEADAMRQGNNVKYGLTGYIWTNNTARAHRVAQGLEAGMVWVNSENVRHLPTPFGGMKASGVGRDGGDYSFDFYTETKNICIALGDHRIPKLGV